MIFNGCTRARMVCMYVANDAISRGSRYQRNKRYDEGIVFPTRADCPIRKMMAIIWITFLHVSSKTQTLLDFSQNEPFSPDFYLFYFNSFKNSELSRRWTILLCKKKKKKYKCLERVAFAKQKMETKKSVRLAYRRPAIWRALKEVAIPITRGWNAYRSIDRSIDRRIPRASRLQL